MESDLSASRLATGLTFALLLTGCTSDAIAPSIPVGTVTPTVSAPEGRPSATADPRASPTGTATTPPSPTPAVTEADDITYGATGPLMLSEQVDVYAPSKLGLWPSS